MISTTVKTIATGFFASLALAFCSPPSPEKAVTKAEPETEPAKLSLDQPGTPLTDARRAELESLDELWKDRLSLPQDTRIVGGVPAKAGEFPWAAALFLWHEGSQRWRQYCGGTLISAEWIVTAAHCPVSTRDLIVIGRNDLTTTEGEVHEVENVFKHPSYDRRNHDSDISLVRIRTKSQHSPAPLFASDEATAAGKETTVIGWGHVKEGGPASPILRKVDVAFVDWDACSSNYESCAPDCPNPPWTLTANMICAGEDGKDSCQGDSGGGLLVYDANEEGELGYHLAGVVSFGLGCAREKYPGVYTKVTNFRSWIEETTSSP